MIAFSTSCYSLGKIVGAAEASALMNRMVAKDPSLPLRIPVPECIETLRTLEQVSGDVIAVHTETATSHLGAMRSRAQHWAMVNTDCEAWVSCDDDNSASPAALATMLHWLRRDVPTAVAIPCVLRTSNVDNVFAAPGARVLHLTGNAHPVVPIQWAGWGIVGVNRAALTAIGREHESLAYVDVDGIVRLASFSEMFIHPPALEALAGWNLGDEGKPVARRAGEWLREDRAWWARLPEAVEAYAVCAGESSHAGRTLDLWDWSAPLRDDPGEQV